MDGLWHNLSFLYSAGLFGLLSLAIPLIIHLFNKSRGRLVRIGSIELVRQSRQRRVTEVKLAQYLLLVLRLLIFFLAALVLAQLVRQGLATTDNDTAYVAPAWLQNASTAALDDMLTASTDTDTYLLEAGFRPLSAALAREIAQTKETLPESPGLWALLLERLGSIRHLGGVKVYSVARVSGYGSRLPNLPAQVQWVLAPVSGPLPLAEHMPHSVLIVYAPAMTEIAAVFAQMLQTLKQHRLPALTWHEIPLQDWDGQSKNQDWLILLGESVEYVNTHTGKVLWATAQGAPLLFESYPRGRRQLSFLGALDKAQNSLLSRPEFPELFLHLMLTPRQKSLLASAAVMPLEQLELMNSAEPAARYLPHTLLQTWLVALLLLLWLVERVYSERKTPAHRKLT